MMIYPTFKDLKTGTIAKYDSYGFSLFWWSDGNGCCDCNRAECFPESFDEELKKHYGEGICFGCERFIAIDVEGDLEGHTKEEVLQILNQGYKIE